MFVLQQPVPVAARSKAWISHCSVGGTGGLNPAEVMDVSLVTVVCSQVEVSATGPSLTQGSPTECGVSN
jgi:hypothetical protein